VNITDFNVPIPEGDMLVTIFNHQRNLMDRYHPIEEANIGRSIYCTGVRDSSGKAKWFFAGPLDIHNRTAQSRFKEFAWRITEEITEATLAIGDETHYQEELIDALHFSVELMCLCGISEDDLVCHISATGRDKLEDLFSYSHVKTDPSSIVLKILAYETVEKLGEACNRLKLKPWKTTAVLTDEKAFRQSLIEFFSNKLIALMKASGFDAKTLTACYLNKNAVNQFRIGSKY
jgi:dUTPase